MTREYPYTRMTYDVNDSMREPPWPSLCHALEYIQSKCVPPATDVVAALMVLVFERERERECVCVCVYAGVRRACVRACVCVCVCVCVYIYIYIYIHIIHV